VAQLWIVRLLGHVTFMRMTPKEFSKADDAAQKEWLLTETDPRKILELLHLESHNCNPTLFERCKVAVSILISEQQSDSARKLERFTFWLIVLTVVLIAVALLALVPPFMEMLCHVHQ
jgi:hypothetical protein